MYQIRSIILGLKLILNGSDLSIPILLGPLLSLGLKYLKQLSVQIGEGLPNDGHILALPDLHGHHGDQRVPARYPLLHLRLEVADAGHDPCESVLDQDGRVHTQIVAVVAIELGRECTTAFVPEIMCLGRKFARIL